MLDTQHSLVAFYCQIQIFSHKVDIITLFEIILLIIKIYFHWAK
ncbi:hypothetical protein ykris0001_26250 [Yersinia kristensenii ATCC 33638]|nr:hypothetical protein ykris0001_26250 [Yersinia kristensenii ATCC 33638]